MDFQPADLYGGVEPLLHGGDLIFDCANHLVHLYTVYGSDNGVLFAYKNNMKSIERVVDTTGLITGFVRWVRRA